MFDIGRVCVKIAGRDAGKKCIIIDIIDNQYVLIDGQTRRRKCNIKHLEPLSQLVQVSKNAPAPEIVRVCKELGILVEDKKPKAKEKPKVSRPTRSKKRKEKPVKEAKPAKAAKKKEAVKEEKKPEPKAEA